MILLLEIPYMLNKYVSLMNLITSIARVDEFITASIKVLGSYE